jgi:gamma-glutamyltranspeptidase/glutathione hydrolase
LARDGFPAHSGLVRQHRSGITDNFEKFSGWPGTAGVYLPNGEVPKEGQLIRNPALADMYLHLVKAERVVRGDRKAGLDAVFAAFYRGDIAAEIARFVKEKGGLLERSDFDRFHIPIEKSAHIDFGGAEIHKCGPWNQGPALLQSLTILKNFDLGALGHNSAEYIHVVLEAMKLAFADREQYYGDPDQVPVPLQALLSDDYGILRAALIEHSANAEIRPGDPSRMGALLAAQERLGGAAWGPGTVPCRCRGCGRLYRGLHPSGGWIRSSEVIRPWAFRCRCGCPIAISNQPGIPILSPPSSAPAPPSARLW